MKVTLAASTGVKIEVWREEEEDLFHAQRAVDAAEPQTCVAVDLFEVIAEVAELDLDDPMESAEAVSLARQALRRLHAA